MNNLAMFTQKLNKKPHVTKESDIKVIILPSNIQKIEAKEAEMPLSNIPAEPLTKIVIEKDNGSTAIDTLKRLEAYKLTKVVKKLPEEPQVDLSIIEEQQKVKSKPKKQKATTVLLEERAAEEDIVEGGPQLQDIGNLERERQEEAEPEIVNAPSKAEKRYTKRAVVGVINLGPEGMIQIGDTSLSKRLPAPPVYDIRASSYYMNNREVFVDFINDLFEPYKDDLLDDTKDISCDNIGKDTGRIDLLTHQKIVRDYINLYTPYRGLLLFHGLGSGKTCSSIAIAEGLKSYKQVIIMTPASLRRNYIEEIKKCGDLLFRKNQFWEWISVESNQELLNPLSGVLGISVEYIKRRKGAWLVNVTKPSNFEELSTPDKQGVNEQIDEMIQYKYKFINYNGLRRSKFQEMTNNFETNIFDNSVVIIDEAHNLISRIVNKINKANRFSEMRRGPGEPLPAPLALQLYEFLLRAVNCRVILLTGTPIINYPNEIGILFNILRGYIKTWNLPLNIETSQKINKDKLQEIFSKEKILDYVDYIPSSKILTITRNPFGFENKIKEGSGYKGVYNRNETIDPSGRLILDERGVMSDEDFISRITKLLKKNDIQINPRGITFTVNTALPDTLNTFVSNFINLENGNVMNIEKFKRRIIGLTSYFKSAQEELLPKYDKEFDRVVVNIPMSDYQFQIYEDARHNERKNEKAPPKQMKVDKDGLFISPTSTYKIFSRLFCNFVMPRPPGRPTPNLIKSNQASIWLDKYLKESREKRITDVQNNIKTYIEGLPGNIRENLGENQEIKARVEQYYDRFIVKQFDVVDFQTFLSKEYQDNLIRIEQRKAQENPKTKTKAQQKAEEKAEKERQKAEEKAEKDRLKAEEKAEKDRLKAEEKAEKDRLKAEEKAEKDRLKAEKKKGKGYDSDTSTSSDSDTSSTSSSDSDTSSDSDSDTDYKSQDKKFNAPSYLLKGGAKSDEMKEDKTPSAAAASAASVDAPLANPLGLIDELDNGDEDEENRLGQLEGYKDEDALNRTTEELEGDEILERMATNPNYSRAMAEALDYLKKHKQKYLSLEGLATYSPKFLAMIENIEDPQHPGLNLVYSQFRSMEGIGIFALALEANGYARFKISKTSSNTWDIVMSDEDMGKRHYALYTGTEDSEEREIIRNIYNGDWKYIPNNIAAKLRTISSNNDMGEIIKVLMITSAGSEGINLRNTRYVHIMEPYWHPVRLEQVIGRARRICSHQGLPLELRTVQVFIYIMTFTEKQLDSEFAVELKLKDGANTFPFKPQSSDEKLFEISMIKENLSGQILKAIKSTSIDCATHSKSNNKEGIVCLRFREPTINSFSFNPNIEQDQNDTIADINRQVNNWDVRPITIKSTGKQYMLRLDTNQIYDYDSVIQSKQIPGVNPILIGQLSINIKGEYVITK
jgi:hypothetical protein